MTDKHLVGQVVCVRWLDAKDSEATWLCHEDALEERGTIVDTFGVLLGEQEGSLVLAGSRTDLGMLGGVNTIPTGCVLQVVAWEEAPPPLEGGPS